MLQIISIHNLFLYDEGIRYIERHTSSAIISFLLKDGVLSSCPIKLNIELKWIGKCLTVSCTEF